MHALTVRQPWAHAIAHFAKTVENRSRRPPARLLGQRVAIHVSQASDDWEKFAEDVDNDMSVQRHQTELAGWVLNTYGESEDGRPPHAGRIIATARLVGIIGKAGSLVSVLTGSIDGDACDRACTSPWFTGPVGWVLADVRALRAPVGNEQLEGLPCLHAPWGLSVRHAPRSDGVCECCGHPMRGAIVGKVYPFALSPEVEAAVIAAEVQS